MRRAMLGILCLAIAISLGGGVVLMAVLAICTDVLHGVS